LVSLVRYDKTKAEYHLHGFSNFDKPLKKLAVLGAIGGAIANSVLLELFQDSRVSRRLVELEACMRDEVSFTKDIAPYAWRRLVEIIGEGGYRGIELHAYAQQKPGGVTKSWQLWVGGMELLHDCCGLGKALWGGPSHSTKQVCVSVLGYAMQPNAMATETPMLSRPRSRGWMSMALPTALTPGSVSWSPI